ncbi:hypothetical protein D5R81_18275 [Parashewanella spongiae]|uniref:DUF4878 domain-containing protein n=1 Tax=Parashewanella spongiae TaxID=342950 RepID=A0A3A6TWZ9_9GAMM|nr:hypothetical protein [Parashewanella spongiae]MCL1079977.1 hypothetical protein [Parashewanella spongiae]RJY05995.1 hypothetical protein D5R81_18275 [Parashewanella spongiae]
MKWIVIILTLIVSGCGPQQVEKGSPEDISIKFFSSIYIERDIKKSTQFVTSDIKQLLNHYHIASAVQRNVIGLSMTDVEFEIEDIDIDFFRRLTKDVTVRVKFRGLKGGSPWVDDRTLRLKRRDDSWVIVELLPERIR